MKRDVIPDEDHVARFCKKTTIYQGEIQASAFILRKKYEPCLSVNWLEYLKCQNREEEIIEIRNILSSKLALHRDAKIAVLNVGEVCDLDRENLEVLHNPALSDPSHSGIYSQKEDEGLIAELILQVIRNDETYPALI